MGEITFPYRKLVPLEIPHLFHSSQQFAIFGYPRQDQVKNDEAYPLRVAEISCDVVYTNRSS